MLPLTYRPSPCRSHLVLATALATAWATSLSGSAQTVLSSGHVDIGIAYEDGAWDLHVHKEFPEPEEEFEPTEAIFQLGAVAQLAGGVPDDPSSTAFFGPAGSTLWVLPKTQHPDLPFLGLGAEELSPDDWLGDLTVTLEAVTGPGNVFVWDVGAFGNLQPKFSSRDGITEADILQVSPGSHAHYFWAFSAPGTYEVHLSASGQNALDGAVSSEPAPYIFQVIPEPSILPLLALGALVMARRRPR